MLERLIELANSVPSDKVAHFVGGVVLFFIGQFWGYGLALAAIGAVGKEIYDHFHPNHTADWKDALATILGGVFGYVIAVLF